MRCLRRSLMAIRGVSLLVVTLACGASAAHATTTLLPAVIYGYDGATPSAQGALTSLRESLLIGLAAAATAPRRLEDRGFVGHLAAEEVPAMLGPGTSFGSKIEGQLAGRGWTKRLVESTIENPERTVATRDTRWLPGGGRMDDPATAFYSRRGGYVVRNNRTGDIVQVSNRTDPGWRAPWDR